MVVAKDFESFADGIVKKVIVEIALNDRPACVFAQQFGSGLR
jgi:hypothetical protein